MWPEHMLSLRQVRDCFFQNYAAIRPVRFDTPEGTTMLPHPFLLDEILVHALPGWTRTIHGVRRLTTIQHIDWMQDKAHAVNARTSMWKALARANKGHAQACNASRAGTPFVLQLQDKQNRKAPADGSKECERRGHCVQAPPKQRNLAYCSCCHMSCVAVPGSWSTLTLFIFDFSFCCHKTRKSLLRFPPWARSKTLGGMSTRAA